MEPVYGFHADRVKRIAESVRTTEGLPADIAKRIQQYERHTTPILPTIGFAQEDVAAGESGTFRFAKGLPGEEEEDSAREIEVCNSTHGKIKSGMKCVLSWLMVEQSGGSSWHVVYAKGFIRIKGLTTGAVTGSGFSINTVRAMQGADPRSDTSSDTETVSVENRLSEYANSGAYCEAVWDESTQTWVSNHLNSTCPP